jgi:hypothetical protein
VLYPAPHWQYVKELIYQQASLPVERKRGRERKRPTLATPVRRYVAHRASLAFVTDIFLGRGRGETPQNPGNQQSGKLLVRSYTSIGSEAHRAADNPAPRVAQPHNGTIIDMTDDNLAVILVGQDVKRACVKHCKQMVRVLKDRTDKPGKELAQRSNGVAGFPKNATHSSGSKV